MELDIDEEKYYASEDTEDEEAPHPPSWSSISQLSSPDFSTSSSEDEDDVSNVACQQPQLVCGHCPLNPEGVMCAPLLGPPMGKAVKLHM
jgi:hypothetical protein